MLDQHGSLVIRNKINLNKDNLVNNNGNTSNIREVIKSNNNNNIDSTRDSIDNTRDNIDNTSDNTAKKMYNKNLLLLPFSKLTPGFKVKQA